MKALLFDVFGTVVDWRGSIADEGKAWAEAKGLEIDSARFADLLTEFHIAGLTNDEKDHWNRVWRRLKPWPDSVPGLTRLRTKYTIAPLSNGNIALLTAMAKNAGLPWDLILSAELAQHYKPDPEAYLTAIRLLELKPEEVMMCAAHTTDLIAARDCGLSTAFVHRPDEFGPTRIADQARPGDFDIVSADILDLARQLHT